jgi:hypothetical protein
MRPYILNTISHYFLFEFNLSNLLHLRSLLPLEERKLDCFPPSPLELISSNFFVTTIHLQFYTSILQWKNKNL